jgi:Flp pilus assembly protein TadD
MSSHIERARLLINQSRYELATKELQKALADDPDDPVAHALMAVCLAERKRLTHDNDVNLCAIDHEFTYPQFRFM